MSDKTRIIAYNKPIGGEAMECLIDSGQSVADAFPDLSAQVEVDINGRLVPKEEYPDCIFSADDTVTMVRMPAGGDGGGKDILRTSALLAVAIGASVISGGALAPVFGSAFSAGAFASAAVATGVAIGGSLLVNTLIPPPDIRSAGGETSQFARRGALTGSRNQLAPYAPIPRVYGHMRMYPPMSVKPYTEIVGNQQYLRLLFNLGPGPLSLSNPKIGDTVIGSFDSNNNFSSNGTYEDVEIDVAESPKLYSQDVDQQDVGVTLAGSNDNAIRTTVAGTDEASIDIVFPGGLFGINDAGDIVQRSVGFTLEYRAVGTTPWISTNGYKTTTQCGQGRLNQRLVRIDQFDDCTQVQTDDPAPYYIRNDAKETYRSGIAFDLPDNGQYEIRLTRLTPTGNDDQSLGTVYSDSATWTALRSIKTDRPTNLPGTVQVAIRIKATDQLNGILDEFNVEAKSRLAYYNGTSWDEPSFNPATGTGTGGIITSSPAWIVADIFAGKSNQQAVDFDMLDADAFKYWADTFGEDFQYNSVIDSSATVQQLAGNIAGAGRASWGVQDGQYRPILDESGQSPIQMFTPRNSSSFSASKTFPDELHGLKMKFRNKDNGWKEDEAIVYQDGYSKDGTDCRFGDGSGNCKVAAKFTEVQLDGVTSWDQAWRLGRYKLAERILRPEVFTYKADIEQLRCQRGDVVFMASDVTLWGSTWGRLKEVQRNGSNEVTQLVLDQPVIMGAGKDYNIRIREEDGGYSLLSVQTQESETDIIAIDSPAMAAINEGDLFTFGEDGKEAVPLKIINIRPGNNLTATLTLVDRADGIHDADQGAIPAYNSNITEPTAFDNTTPPVPIIDSVRSDDNSLYKDEDGTFRLRMLVSFSIQPGNQTTEVEARFRAAGSREGWIGLFKADANLGVVSLPDVTKGKDYIIQLRGRYKNNVSEWAEFATNHTVQGKQQRPPNVTGFNAIIDKTLVRLTWNPVDETDNEQYEVRKGVSWAAGTFIDKSKRTLMTDQIDDTGQITYWIKAIDTSGNYSQTAADTIITIDPKYGGDPLYPGADVPGLDEDNTWTGSNVFQGNVDLWQQYTDIGLDYEGQNVGLRMPRAEASDKYLLYDANLDRIGTKNGAAGNTDAFILESDIFPDGDYQPLGPGDAVQHRTLALLEGATIDDVDGYVTSQTFAGGFGGNGTRVDQQGGDWNATYDNLVVRKAARFYELIVEKVRANGGTIVVSPGAEKITGAELAGDGSWSWTDDINPFAPGATNPEGVPYSWTDQYECFIEEDKYITIDQNDLVWRQQWTGRGTGVTEGGVIATETGSATETVNDPPRSFTMWITADSEAPQAGHDFAVIGNTTDPARQNGIIITASDTGNPYRRIYAGVDSLEKFGAQETIKGQDGRLDNLVVPWFDDLDGSQQNLYGAYWDGNFYVNDGHFRGVVEITDPDASNAATKDYVNENTGASTITIRSASQPTQRPSGGALQPGDIWIDTSNGDKPYSWDGSSWIASYTEIDGGAITTGVISANRVQIGSGTNYDNNYDPTTKETPGGAQAKANAAESSAVDTSRDNLAAQLGYGNYSAMVSEVQAEGSIIAVGGYLRADLIETDAIKARMVDIDDLLAQDATITGSLSNPANDYVIDQDGIRLVAKLSESSFDVAREVSWVGKDDPDKIIASMYGFTFDQSAPYSDSDSRLLINVGSGNGAVRLQANLSVFENTNLQRDVSIGQSLYVNKWFSLKKDYADISGNIERSINVTSQIIYMDISSGEPYLVEVLGLPTNGDSTPVRLINTSGNGRDFILRDRSIASRSGANIRTQNASDVRVYDGGVIDLEWDGNNTLYAHVDRGN